MGRAVRWRCRRGLRVGSRTGLGSEVVGDGWWWVVERSGIWQWVCGNGITDGKRRLVAYMTFRSEETV